MPFDLSTAKPVTKSGKFDLSTAKPVMADVPPDTPYIGPDGEIAFTGEIKPEQKDRTIGEQLTGVGETALTLGTGATGGTLGMAAGTLKQMADEIRSGNFGTKEAADRIEQEAMRMAKQFTYEPRTETGQEYTKETGEALAPLQALGPMAQEIGAVTRMPKAKTTKPTIPAKDVTQAIESQGIKAMTTDVLPPKTFAGKLGQAVTERIPLVGTGPVRAAQQEQRVKAIRNLMKNYGATEVAAASDDVMASLSNKRGKMLNKYVDMKGDVINKLSDAGAMPVNKTLKVIDSEIDKLKGMKISDVNGVISVLEDYKNAFQGQSIKNIESLRGLLGERFNDPGMAGVKSKADKVVTNIYSALRDDMGNFIEKTGGRGDFKRWAIANKRLSSMIDEVQKTTLKNVLAKGDVTPETVRRMLFSQKPSDIKLLYKNLSPEGRASARTAILQEVVGKAGGIENLTPERFLQIMKRMNKPVDVFFKTDDKKALSGLIEALNYTKQAGVAGVKPPTGAELTAFATPTGLSWLLGGDPVTGMAATAGVGLISRAYESAPIRNLLIKISQSKRDIGPLVDKLKTRLKKLSTDNPEIGVLTGMSAQEQR